VLGLLPECLLSYCFGRSFFVWFLDRLGEKRFKRELKLGETNRSEKRLTGKEGALRTRNAKQARNASLGGASRMRTIQNENHC